MAFENLKLSGADMLQGLKSKLPAGIGEALEGLGTNPELDKTKKELEDLKNDLELKQTPADIMKRLETAFMGDLDELKITKPEERIQYWDKVKVKMDAYVKALREKAVEASPEFKDLQAFTGNLENMAGLKKIIEDKNPLLKAKGWLDQLPGPFKGWIAGVIAGWAISSKNEKSMFAPILNKFAKILGIDPDVKELEDQMAELKKQGKKDEAKQKAEELLALDPTHKEALKIRGAVVVAPAVAPVVTPPPAATEVAAGEKALIDKFATLKLNFDQDKLKEDRTFLATAGLPEKEVTPLLDKALADKGSIRQIWDAVNGVLPDAEKAQFKIRLLDVRFEQKTPDELKLVLDALKKDDKTVARTAVKMREFLVACFAEPDVKKSIEKYKKQNIPIS